MIAPTISELTEVANAIDARFRVSREAILDVVFKMVSARRDCTPDYPAGAPSILAYHAGTARARMVLAPSGYIRDDADQIESAFHPDINVKIVVANTDEGTGLDDHLPRNVSGKGPATRRTVDAAQGSFIETLDASLPVVQFRPERTVNRRDGISVWYLCVYEAADVVRAELSRPKSLTGDFFAGFHERIILIGREGIEVPVGTHDVPDDDSPEFDIPVVRK